MPWKVAPVSDIRFALCHAVRSADVCIATAAREFGVSRKTAHKWLAVFDQLQAASAALSAANLTGHAGPSGGVAAAQLADRSRQPWRSPQKTGQAVEDLILQLRDRHNWGPRKIRAFLNANGHQLLPSVRTCASILTRNNRIKPPAQPAPGLQRFERAEPNQLWQLDFKGAVEVAHRIKVMPLSILDDHSRYLLAFTPCLNLTMNTAWTTLWQLFGQVGLPQQILCDNAFSTMGTANPAGISWFESRLLRLGIDCTHPRAYHPQTQGKVERFHATAMRELINFNARRDSTQNFTLDCDAWRNFYNTQRPHQALNDLPPASRYRPSNIQRPAKLPEPLYPEHSQLRTVSDSGQISVNSFRILIGRGIVGEKVRIEQRDHEIAVYYCQKQIRLLSKQQLVSGKVL